MGLLRERRQRRQGFACSNAAASRALCVVPSPQLQQSAHLKFPTPPLNILAETARSCVPMVRIAFRRPPQSHVTSLGKGGYPGRCRTSIGSRSGAGTTQYRGRHSTIRRAQPQTARQRHPQGATWTPQRPHGRPERADRRHVRTPQAAERSEARGQSGGQTAQAWAIGSTSGCGARGGRRKARPTASPNAAPGQRAHDAPTWRGERVRRRIRVVWTWELKNRNNT